MALAKLELHVDRSGDYDAEILSIDDEGKGDVMMRVDFDPRAPKQAEAILGLLVKAGNTAISVADELGGGK